jgi:hypothetical protein
LVCRSGRCLVASTILLYMSDHMFVGSPLMHMMRLAGYQARPAGVIWFRSIHAYELG